MCRERVILLGGNGFVCSRLSAKLVKRGACVSSFDLQFPRSRVEGVNYLLGDFFETDVLFEALENQDIIVHAISTLTPSNSNQQFLNGYERDFIQTIKLLERAGHNKQRVLFLSSGGTVYGHINGPVSEDAPCKPNSHYANLKLCIENVMRIMAIRGADFLIARISNLYGPGQDYKKGVGFIDAAIKRTLAGVPIEIWGDGTIIRDYLYIDDACEMLYNIMMSEIEERTVNLGTGIGTSQIQVIHILENMFGKIKVQWMPAREVDLPYNVLDPSRYEIRFGRHVRTLETGIRNYVDYLLSQNREI